MLAQDLIESARYRVRYRLDGQRRDRELVGTYLGSGLLGGLHFDLRPVAGTTTVPTACFIDAELVRGDTPAQLPTVVI